MAQHEWSSRGFTDTCIWCGRVATPGDPTADREICKKRPSQKFDVSEKDIEAIEEAVGCGHGAWDMEDPSEIIAECWNQFIRKSNK